MNLYDFIKYKDNKIQTDIIILDFLKAFDAPPHDKLLYKLRCYGITGDMSDWIFVFLKQKGQKVVVDGKQSNCVHYQLRYSTGNILAPVPLFLIYINELSKCISKQ